jgi:DNA (cytosine-5)-methyltransferase 1
MARLSRLGFVSIFSGCGGFDAGFEKAGFQCEAAFDSDSLALENHSRYFGVPTHNVDLSTHSLGRFGTVDVLLAGPPCQGFSTAGKRRFDDSRNHLLLSAGNIVTQIKPKVCIIENVPGVTAGAHCRFWNALKIMLQKSGYRTLVLRCYVHKLGLAQLRTRLVMIGWRIDRDHPDLHLPERDAGTLRSALAGIEGAHNHAPEYLPISSRLAIIASKIRPGQKLCNVRSGSRSIHTWKIPEVFGSTSRGERDILEAIVRLRRRERVRIVGDADPVSRSRLRKYLSRDVEDDLHSLLNKQYVRRIGSRFDLTRTFNGKFRRLSWNEPSLTVDTRFGDPRYFLHPDENRGFTVREAARIQGFPDDYIFSGSIDAQYRMIGNAVPPPMGTILGKIVRAAFFS